MSGNFKGIKGRYWEKIDVTEMREIEAGASLDLCDSKATAVPLLES